MSPSKKIRKLDAGGKKTPPDGTIRFEVDKVSTLNRKHRVSPVVEVKGIPWCMEFNKYKGIVKSMLCCLMNQSTPWRIDVDAEFILVHSDSSNNMSHKNSGKVDSENHRLYAHLNGIDSDEKEYVVDDKLTVEVRFWITNMRGIMSVPIDFTDANDPRHDIALVIDGEKVYANKGILAVHSPYFQALFSGNFVEGQQKEVKLDDVDRKEFIDMLRVIYPVAQKYLSVDSAEYLLKLGDRFDILKVMERAEEFLIDSDEMETGEKLRLADKYRLYALLEHSLSELKDAEDMNEIKQSPIYSDLSNDTLRAFNDRTMSLWMKK